MKQNLPLIRASYGYTCVVLLTGLLFAPFLAFSQAVTGVITDYNGFFKTSSASVNPIRPNNSHNLLAFTYNGIQYSTGVDDSKLAAHGETFTASDFWSLPVGTLSSAVNASTKVGLGALYDGVANGPSNPAPEYGISKYLTDGIKGLNLGTCIANLPVGTLSFSIGNIQPSSIGDGIPDILVTQVADPTGSSYDRYDFVDQNGARVGSFKDIIFTNITPVAHWTADFYDAVNPMRLSPGFTQTDRPIRLWAADLSEFGITQANYASIRNFRITLCGNSDVAFVGYNNRSITLTYPLPVTLSSFQGSRQGSGISLDWQTAESASGESFVVERSLENGGFQPIATLTGATGQRSFRFTDRNAGSGTVYYRLKMAGVNGRATYSSVVVIHGKALDAAVGLYPNPAQSFAWLRHPSVPAQQRILVYQASGLLVRQLAVMPSSLQTRIGLQGLPAGVYRVVLEGGEGRSLPLVVN